MRGVLSRAIQDLPGNPLDLPIPPEFRIPIPTVASNDCHYLKKGDAFAHDVLLCIGTQRMLDDPGRLKYASEEFYLKSEAEMAALFPDDPGAIERTLEIAERCDVQIGEGQFHLPEVPGAGG